MKYLSRKQITQTALVLRGKFKEIVIRSRVSIWRGNGVVVVETPPIAVHIAEVEG